MKSSEWYARRYIERFGFAIVPAEPRSKAPSGNSWGDRAMRDADQAASFFAANGDWNMGLSLGLSGMCSLDIDCEESFRLILSEFGIPIEELDVFPTVQGSSKGRRILFRMPEGTALDYHKLDWPNKADPDGSKHRELMRNAQAAKEQGDTDTERQLREEAKQFARYTVFEIRQGNNRFDVLPPSIHPDTGKPYRWTVQPPKTRDEWPEPPAWLVAIWQAWAQFKPQLEASCPWAPKLERKTTPAPARSQSSDDSGSVIEKYIDANPLTSTLERYGYVRKGKSRYLSPYSSTGLPGVILFEDQRSCFIHHASDPLCSDETGRPVNSFDLFCHYDHGGDVSKAVKAAAQELGLQRERKRTPEAKELAATQEPSSSEPKRDTPCPPDAQKPGMPFRPLGYNGNSYYYLPRGTEQVAEIRRGAHTSASDMLALAPIEWWEMAYPKDKGGVDWQQAASDMMRMCERAGIYTAERERGRGAWFDEGRAVLHLGTNLMVDGELKSISDHQSKHIYTKQAPMEMGVNATTEQADDELGERFTKLFDQINWAKPVHSIFAIGWCVLAPVCGGLKWRPHLWLTARRGAGKTWIQNNMVAPLLGPCALMVQGNTSEAGIRQSIKQDARPIVFDEAESEDAQAMRRMQSVIELARQSSSDSMAQIAKGTADGQGMAFRMRSMFLLGSINVSLSQAADESRFTVVTIAPHERTPEEIERFARFSAEVGNLFTPDNCAAIRARIYRMLPTIRKNASVFAKAVADGLGDQRIGDQIGALLAGWYALLKRDEVTTEQALYIVRQLDFSDAEEAEQVSDEESCLARILQSQVRFDTNEGHKQRSIGELVDCARGKEVIQGLTAMEANAILGRYGLRVEGRYLDVANRHAELQRLLRESPWAAGWRTILRRIDGARPLNEPARFAGVLSRGTRIPLS